MSSLVVKNRQGMTLIEIVVALALLAILGLSFVSLFASSMNFLVSSDAIRKNERELRIVAESSSCTAMSDATMTFSNLTLTIEGKLCSSQQEGVTYVHFQRNP